MFTQHRCNSQEGLHQEGDPKCTITGGPLSLKTKWVGGLLETVVLWSRKIYISEWFTGMWLAPAAV